MSSPRIAISRWSDQRSLGGFNRSSQQLRRCQPAVSCNDLAILVDQHRVGKAERADAVRDLPYLLAAVRTCIARRGFEFVEFAHARTWQSARNDLLRSGHGLSPLSIGVGSSETRVTSVQVLGFARAGLFGGDCGIACSCAVESLQCEF